MPGTNGITSTNTTAIDCNSGSTFEGLNLTNMCDRSTIDTLIMTLMYLLIVVVGLISNGSVILASIFERWKEIDQFTFVMAVSQAFCHFLFALFVYPMGAYSIIQESHWNLGKSWCWQTALLSSYFEIMYVLHIMMLGADIIIGRFTKLKDKVFVALSKRVALSLWVVAAFPQIYEYFSKGRSDSIFGFDDSNPSRPLCYATYVYPTWAKFLEYLGIFIALPMAFSVIQYIILLKQSNKRHSDDVGKTEKNRSFWMNYRTSFIMIILYAISQFPRWIYIFITIAEIETDYRIADVIVVWSSFGSILIPFGYLVTCPTYFGQVTQFTWMAWLKRFEHIFYKKNTKDRELIAPTEATSDI
ncbi:uncharacterized protein LOC134818770 [Bolinopsis microptera]|uniref:uncharacterized protein LOC134818770 n=1 Tax=Bolinopsis microptera TaxID=2820187 RepID=UPI00307A7C8E